jgi:polyisoprenyl-phosphate glycosyltransferase
MALSAHSMKLTIAIPVLDDWGSVTLLIRKLDEELSRVETGAEILLIDDGSTTEPDGLFLKAPLSAISRIERLRLRRNLGHQRAIAIGLTFLAQERGCDAVLVMDGDGEDKPEDVPRLIETFLGQQKRAVVFAQRVRRSEGIVFRVFYLLYRWLHRLFTGISVRVGNFSIISKEHLQSLVVVSDIWNHYAASVYKARLPMTLVPTNRGVRLAGQSKLNFVGLVVHGLSAISVFAETVGVRLILGTGVLMLLAVMLLAAVVMIRITTDMAIPGWATSAVGLLLVIVLQMMTLVVGLTFSVLFSRNNLTFLPIRDYQFFVAAAESLYVRPR